jgi:uncharacterized damage-inducible protein DinB
MADMWTDQASDPRVDANPVGELATYREYLTNYRLTLGMKCDDLAPEQLATRSVPPSTMSLLGLVRHLAKVENSWFHRVLQQHEDSPKLFWRPGEPDLDFDGAEPTRECVDEAFAAWREQIAMADAFLDRQTEDTLADTVTFDGDETASIRDVVVHMIEEYARHCGHADLLRECIDGRTGQ